MTDRELMQEIEQLSEIVQALDAKLADYEARARLAQPEQEPVAWLEIESYIDADNLWDSRKVLRDYDSGAGIPLYTAPPQREWQGLTDEEIGKCLQATAKAGDTLQLISAIEAKLKEKNA